MECGGNLSEKQSWSRRDFPRRHLIDFPLEQEKLRNHQGPDGARPSFQRIIHLTEIANFDILTA